MVRKKAKKGHPTNTNASASIDHQAAALDFIIAALERPNEPAHCGKCLYGVLLTVTSKQGNVTDTPAHFPPALRKKVEFWRTLYVFIVTPRTDEEIDKLLDNLATCTCFQTLYNGTHFDATKSAFLRAAHDSEAVPNAILESIRRVFIQVYAPPPDKIRYADVRIAFLIKCFCVLFAGLSDTGVRNVAKGVADTWPMSSADLIPFGADQLVRTFMQWFQSIPDPIVIEVMGELMRVLGPSIALSLSEIGFTKLVVEYTRSWVDTEWAFLESTDIDDSHIMGNPTIRSTTSTSQPSTFSFFMRYYHVEKAFLSYFRHILIRAKQNMRGLLISPYEVKAMQLCSILAYIAEHPKVATQGQSDREYVAKAANLGQILFRWFHMHLWPHPDMPVHPTLCSFDKKAFPPPESVKSLRIDTYAYIRIYHRDSHCSAYNCRNSIQTAGRSFQRCARCQIVSYCGRECQTRAWRDEAIPHKRICPIMRHLVEVAGGHQMFGIHVPETPSFATFEEILAPQVLKRWKDANVAEENLNLICKWAELDETTYSNPNASRRNTGFEDYNLIIKRLSSRNGASKPGYMDRLQRWPSEVAEQQEMLQTQPFWDEDIPE